MEINNDIINRFLEKNISKTEKELLLKWLQHSEENKIHFKKTVKAWEISQMFIPNANRDYSLQKILTNSNKKLYSLYYRIAGLVAILVIAILTITFITQTNKTIYKTVFTENNKTQVILPDNSMVWLNANSSIKYPSKFNKKREVTLKGEAFFDVIEDKNSPFTVSTSNIEIEVLGTRFSVIESTLSDEIATVLESGKISLQIDNFSENYILKPNDKLSYNKKTNKINIEKVDAKKYTTWINKRLVFENIPFEDVFKQLGEWYNIEIIIMKDTIKEIPISFILDEESLVDVLNTLQLIESFEYEQSENKIIIK